MPVMVYTTYVSLSFVFPQNLTFSLPVLLQHVLIKTGHHLHYYHIIVPTTSLSNLSHQHYIQLLNFRHPNLIPEILRLFYYYYPKFMLWAFLRIEAPSASKFLTVRIK